MTTATDGSEDTPGERSFRDEGTLPRRRACTHGETLRARQHTVDPGADTVRIGLGGRQTAPDARRCAHVRSMPSSTLTFGS